MTSSIAKDSIDLGIVVRDPEAALQFYRDTLGLPYQTKLDMPGGMTMHRLLVGGSVVKIVSFENAPEATSPPGGLNGATGMRYFTITVSNLEATTQAAADAGYNVVVKPTDIRPGIKISMIEDPEGNWVELLQEG
ncbi:MAG: VOC family protein [Acidobacteriota bacterium]